MSDTIDNLPGNSGWRAFWLVRLMKFIFIDVLWWYVGRPIWVLFKWSYQYSVAVCTLALTNTITFARTRWNWLVHGYEPSDDAFGRWIDSRVSEYMNRRSIRIPFTIGALIIGTPLMFIMVLLIGFGIPVVICIAIDQITYPRHELTEEFRIDGPAANHRLTPEERGIIVTDALVYQLEQELNSVTDMSFDDWKKLKFNGFWGWTPNDLAGFGPLAWPGLFDNRQNRQLGVIYGVRIMTDCWSKETSKLGSADRENVDLVRARTEGFSFASKKWIFPASEGYYRDGIDAVRKYQDGLRRGDPNTVVNVTTKNLANTLRCMDSMLQEPYGRLIDRSSSVVWTKIDDEIFYAQGAAIVARDMLAAIAVAYADEFQRGQLDRQVAEAVDSLSAAARFNPYWNLRGDGDSMFGDHRSKEARYVSEALRRIEDIYEALES